MKGFEHITEQELESDPTRPGIRLKKKESHEISDQNCSSISVADMESSVGNASFRTQSTTGLDTPCCLRVHSRLHRLTRDVDGVCPKYAIDGLVKAGILPDDSPKYIKEVRLTQEKIPKECEEETYIILEWEDNELSDTP